MVLNDKYTYLQILGNLMKQPFLLLEYSIEPSDFGEKLEKIIFITIRNFFKKGAINISVIEIDQEIHRYEASSIIYDQNNGYELLNAAYEYSDEKNFKFYYDRLKKFSLIKKLKKEGYDISPFYKDSFLTLKEENETIENFDNSTVIDILNYVESKYNKIKKDFLYGEKDNTLAASGIFELISQFEKSPEIGVPICGDLFNTAFMGARLGKYFLRSGKSGLGKSRLAVFDACKIAYPIYWSHSLNNFVKEVDIKGNIRKGRKTLIITTELSRDEIQTMILAYLSGVNEKNIILNRYKDDEKQRVLYAAKIMDLYKDFLFIDEISDPNLTNVQSTIKKYATIDKVKYVFYDYIFSSPSLVGQFADVKLREDRHKVMSSYIAFPQASGVAFAANEES